MNTATTTNIASAIDNLFSNEINFSSIFTDKTSKNTDDKIIEVKDGYMDAVLNPDGSVNQVNSLPRVSKLKEDNVNTSNFSENTKDTGSVAEFPPNAYTYEWKNVSTGTGRGSEIFPRSTVKSAGYVDRVLEPLQYDTSTYAPRATRADYINKFMRYITALNPFSPDRGVASGFLAGAYPMAIAGGLTGAAKGLWDDYNNDSVDSTVLNKALIGAGIGGGLGGAIGASAGKDTDSMMNFFNARK